MPLSGNVARLININFMFKANCTHYKRHILTYESDYNLPVLKYSTTRHVEQDGSKSQL